MRFYDWEYTKWYNGEWNIPTNYALMEYIIAAINTGVDYRIEDCLATPSGSRITGIWNAKGWGNDLRVLYSYKNEDGDAPATGILRFFWGCA